MEAKRVGEYNRRGGGKRVEKDKIKEEGKIREEEGRMQLKLKMLILLNFPPERMRELRSKKFTKMAWFPGGFIP